MIELMLASAIIGLIATIAIPKFANMIIKAKEAAVKGKLGALRSAFSIYYADTEGFSPAYPGSALVAGGKYMDQIPFISIPTVPNHKEGNGFYPLDIHPFRHWFTSSMGISNPWAYSSSKGTIFVHCSDPDSNGQVWSTW